MKRKNEFKLYNFYPAFLVLVFTPVGFVPVIGYFVFNLIASVIASCVIQKRFDIKTVLKTAGFSYLLALSVLFIMVFFAGYVSVLVFGAEATYNAENFTHIIEYLVAFIFFTIGSGLIFVFHFFWTSRQFTGKTKRIWHTRIIITIVMTLVNAPYLLFIPYKQAVYADYAIYHKLVDEKAYEEQRTWKSNDGYLSFKTIERFHRFRPRGDENGIMSFSYDDASIYGKTFSIDFDDWVNDNGGYYNRGRFYICYSNNAENGQKYIPLFSGNYHRNNSNELILEVMTFSDNSIKTPYKAGDTIYLHSN